MRHWWAVATGGVGSLELVENELGEVGEEGAQRDGVGAGAGDGGGRRF